MSTAARKARKRAGGRFTRAAKTATRPYDMGRRGLGLVTGAEVLASLVVKGIA